ncbi:uncharacterized protein LOC117181154 [Belonocnema kinseyi]|uniref:uncharacterized protein LOC117181154 n=1 Tax=Belonocnema kinseyi TaxID=2817044 RepID=UPI00143DA5E1|nr:uncharacterized protein LOC117181154 [Belonocnema kinseyi]
MLVVDDAVAAMVQLKERDDFENAYFDTLTEVKMYTEQDNTSRIEAQSAASSSRTLTPAKVENPLTSETPGVKLPTITLPKFDGTFKDWLPFRDTFKSLIHDNTRLLNIQKFHYLSSTLTGDAARVIQSLGVSDSKYVLAWESVNKRYEDSASLLHYHTKCLFEMSAISKTSHVSL